MLMVSIPLQRVLRVKMEIYGLVVLNILGRMIDVFTVELQNQYLTVLKVLILMLTLSYILKMLKLV